VSFASDGKPKLSHLDEPVQAAPGLLIYAFGAELFYANASRFSEEIMEIVESADPPLRWLALDAAAVGDLDYSGADSVRQVATELEGRGASLVLCSVDPAVQKLLDAYGLTDKIGADRIFLTSMDVLVAYRALPAAAPTGAAPADGTAPAEG
jgi:SulP family sulfate permease